MSDDPQVRKFSETMKKVDRLPELELARQQEEMYKKRFIPEKPRIKLNYVVPKNKQRNI